MQNSRLRSYVSRDRKERSIRLANQWDTDSGIWYRQFPQGMCDFWSRNFIIVRHILVQLHRFSPANELSISAVTPFAAHGLSRVQPRDSRLYNHYAARCSHESLLSKLSEVGALRVNVNRQGKSRCTPRKSGRLAWLKFRRPSIRL